MISEIIYDFLKKMLEKKKYEVIKLRWRKADLEDTLKKLKDTL